MNNYPNGTDNVNNPYPQANNQNYQNPNFQNNQYAQGQYRSNVQAPQQGYPQNQNVNYPPQQGYQPPQPIYPMPQQKKKKPVAVFILFALLIIFVGVGLFSSYRKAEESLDSSNIYFYIDEEQTSDVTKTPFEIKNYTSKYDDYNSKQFYSQLNETDKLIYNAVMFAFDNCETIVFIPQSSLNGREHSLTDILYFVALDSPLVEQNIVNGELRDSLEISTKDIMGIKHSKTVEGVYLAVDNFSKQNFDTKLQAVEKAKQIVATLPAEAKTDYDKAKFCFEYLAYNVEYAELSNEEISNSNFLYDTLIGGKSNCDGFANSYSLLLNMLGVECFEKFYLPDNVEEIGHTWNCVKINGKYYNVDASSAMGFHDKKLIYLSFMNPDSSSYTVYNYSDLLPPCDDTSLASYDCIFSGDESDSQIISTMVTKFNANQRRTVYVYFTNDLSLARINRLVDRFSSSIYMNFSYYSEMSEENKNHNLVILIK